MAPLNPPPGVSLADGQLAGGIAHDFNNVLTSVLGCAGLLKYELTDAQQSHRGAG